jgi:hypothetical protein
MRPRIVATFATPMLVEPPHDISRYAGVNAAIGAFEKVNVVHMDILPLALAVFFCYTS